MSQTLRNRLFQELDALEFVDPHTHIDARRPTATSLAEIMGYHYYTELAHSAGLPREQIEQDGLDPRDKVARLVPHLDSLQNTIQASWLIEIAQSLLGFADDRITIENWESLYDLAAERMAQPGWEREVLRRSKLKAVFLTNDFDDPLEGFDTQLYIPCLRTDDLVFHLARPDVRQRLETTTGIAAGDANALRSAIGTLFERFRGRNAPGVRHLAASRFRTATGLRLGGGPCVGRVAQPGRGGRPECSPASGAFHLLDTGAVLRRVRPAVRPDDWCESRRLRIRGLPGAGPV